MKQLILASASPNRKELLERTGIPFIVIPSDYEEDMTQDLPPHELAKTLSLGKAESVALEQSDSVVLAADTFVLHNNQLLGKPHTPERAREMLRTLSGTTHQVITGYTIIDTDTGTTISKSVETSVWFTHLTDQTINDYVATDEPLECAGSYAIQGKASSLIERVEGDFFNIVGLPLSQIVSDLEPFGFYRFPQV